ncbi:restriction endonuclease subunit S [Plesiomonas shigelloides]|uniref:restriction endonuclease subunit S n=1 Tax=Plesiomonas shigelloides TaxID=703 RepID=UPI00387F01CF
MVPNGWNSKPLAQLLEKIIDYRGQSVPKSSSGIPLITARNVREGYLDFSNQEYVDESKFEEWMTRGIPQKGDILFTTEAPLGKACRYPSEGVYAIGQRTVTLRTNKKLDPEFLLYTILSERGQLLIDLRSSGSTAKGIKSSELKKVKIAYPESLSEQRKIAKILSTWDKAIATTEQLIATSQQQKKALMQQLLTGKKRLLNPETGKVFEGDWLIKHLKNIGKLQAGKFVKASEIFNTEDESLFPCYGGNGLRGFTASYTHEGLYSLIGRQGALCGNITLAEGKFHATEHAVVVTPYKHIDTKWLYYKLIELDLNQYATGQAQPGLSVKNLDPLEVLVAPLKEQQKIASVLTVADKEIELLQAKLAHLKEEKKALMQQLLTGKRRVKVEQDMEIAS